ncbi:MAG TPA: ATP-binding protein [Candidatus Eisenbacteria bacterium]|nr:ATP-binding protein [Candidatus Eisenbacteria bacterium]
MQRTQTPILLFALVAAAVTVLSAVAAYQGMRAAFEREFDRRLVQVAQLVASQVSPEDLADITRLGMDSNGYASLQAHAELFRSTTHLDNLAIVDRARATLYDVRRGDAGFAEPSAYDTLAHATLAHALAGVAGASPPFRLGGRLSRVAVAPIAAGGAPVGAVVAELAPAWGGELERLRRTLEVIAAVSVAAIALLAWLVLRVAGARLELERRLTRAENLAAMGRLTATLAHEIRNPLAIIRGSAKRLGKLDPGAQPLADSVVEEADRLGRTVNRYLQFARGQGDAPASPGDAAAALVATLDLLEGEFAARRCALARAGDLAVPAPVRLDGESLKQVFLNLVLNALAALPEGGRVTATVARAGERVELSIADDGPGIPPEVLRRLGEPFFTTRAQGTGLGLFLSRRLVQSAGGELRIASRAGAGTTCTVALPLAPVRPGAPA